MIKYDLCILHDPVNKFTALSRMSYCTRFLRVFFEMPICSLLRKKIRRHKELDLNEKKSPWSRARRGREQVQLLWSRRLSFTDNANDDFTLKMSVSRPSDTGKQTTQNRHNQPFINTRSPFHPKDGVTGLVLSTEVQDRMFFIEKEDNKEKATTNQKTFEKENVSKDLINDFLNINETTADSYFQNTERKVRKETNVNNMLPTHGERKKVINVPPVKLEKNKDFPSYRSPSLLKRAMSNLHGEKNVNKDLALFESETHKPTCSPNIERLIRKFETSTNTVPAVSIESESPSSTTTMETGPKRISRNHSYIDFSSDKIFIDGKVYKTKSCE